MLNIKWTFTWPEIYHNALLGSRSKQFALITKFRGHMVVFSVPWSVLCCTCLFSCSVCHTRCCIMIRTACLGSEGRWWTGLAWPTRMMFLVALGSVPSRRYRSVWVDTFMVIFFTRGFTLSQKYSPQLCVRQTRSVLCIKTRTHTPLLYHIRLQSTGILADIFWVWI